MTMHLLSQRFAAGRSNPKLRPHQSAARKRILAEQAELDWEICSCPCGADDDWIISEVDRHGLPCRHCLCRRCGVIRISPRWTEARYRRFYASEYRELYSQDVSNDVHSYCRRLALLPASAQIGRYIERSCARFLQDARAVRIMEIGGGGGWNLSHLPQHWTRVGYDVDEAYLSAGAACFQIEMRKGFWDEALAEAADFDVILLSHVVEHVHDPVSSLKRVAASVAPGALIVVEVPGIFRIHRSSGDPMVYMQNAHTFTFCGATLEAFCLAAGLEILEMDEWCRAVLRSRSRRASAPSLREILPDAHRAGHIFSYLRACEMSATVKRRVEGVSAIGSGAARAVGLATNLALRTGLAVGMFGPQRRSSAGSALRSSEVQSVRSALVEP